MSESIYHDNIDSLHIFQHFSYPASRGPSIFLDKSRKIEGPLLAGYTSVYSEVQIRNCNTFVHFDDNTGK